MKPDDPSPTEGLAFLLRHGRAGSNYTTSELYLYSTTRI